jgi:hypothetical protein
MNAKIAFKLLALSQLLARVLALHVLRKLEGALPTPDKLPAIRVLGLIDVRIAPDTLAISDVRSELEANRVTFRLGTDFPNHLVGFVNGIPRMRIELGHGSTLYLMVETADGIEVRSE